VDRKEKEKEKRREGKKMSGTNAMGSDCDDRMNQYCIDTKEEVEDLARKIGCTKQEVALQWLLHGCGYIHKCAHCNRELRALMQKKQEKELLMEGIILSTHYMLSMKDGSIARRLNGSVVCVLINSCSGDIADSFLYETVDSSKLDELKNLMDRFYDETRKRVRAGIRERMDLILIKK